MAYLGINLSNLLKIGTNGFLVQTSNDVFNTRVIAVSGTTSLTIVNPGGIAGNPTINLSLTSADITTALGFTPNSTSSASFSGTMSVVDITASGIVSGSGFTSLLSPYAKLISPIFTGVPLSTTATANTKTTQIATTAFVIGQAGNVLPFINGVTAIGTSLLYARQDHIHPVDITRAAVINPTFTGTATFSSLLLTDAVVVSATDYSKHISLFGGSGSSAYGISITNNRLNVGTSSFGYIYATVGGADIMYINNGGINVTGDIVATNDYYMLCGHSYRCFDTSGNARPMMGISVDNYVNHYVSANSAGWRIVNYPITLQYFYVSPSGFATFTYTASAPNWTSTSDVRLKTDIEDITQQQGVDWIKAGRPRRFQKNGRLSAGFIAQEEMQNHRAEAVIPFDNSSAMFAQSDGIAPTGQVLTRDYNHDVAYVTAALQNALDRIEALEARL